MDPTNFYRLGQIQHQEFQQAAEEHRLAKLARQTSEQPSLWQRLRSHQNTAEVSAPTLLGSEKQIRRAAAQS